MIEIFGGQITELKYYWFKQFKFNSTDLIISRTGWSSELGYEIYTAPQFQLKLFEEIESAGKDLNLKFYGSRALMSLRLEKNWGAWTLDFRPDFTAAESGLDIFINWNKDFVGKEVQLNGWIYNMRSIGKIWFIWNI